MLKLLGRDKKFLLKSLRTLPYIHTESIMLAFHKKEKNSWRAYKFRKCFMKSNFTTYFIKALTPLQFSEHSLLMQRYIISSSPNPITAKE